MDLIKRAIKKFAPFAFLDPEGDEGIEKVGHREYVGGLWDEIGSLQFDFLVAHGLKPQHRLLDIACGSLRLGVKVIPYLEAGHYLGIDKEPKLIEAGLAQELDPAVRDAKRPNLVVSSAFEFEKFGVQADYAIAQSLFSHFPPPLIHTCFQKLRPHLAPGGVFYATYFEVPVPRKNPAVLHDHGYHAYTRGEMERFGEDNGFAADYIGDWKHPRQQVIVAYRPRAA